MKPMACLPPALREHSPTNAATRAPDVKRGRKAIARRCASSTAPRSLWARVVRVLNQLVEVYGRPEALHLGNGPELTADAFVDWTEDNGVKLLFISLGKPIDGGA